MDAKGSGIESSEFGDELRKGKLSRRRAIKMLASIGVGVAVMPLLPTGVSAASEDHPLLFGWAGFDDPEFWVAYTEKYGELPRFTFWGDQEEGIAKCMAGFKPDVLFPCNRKLKKWYDAGLIAPIDVSRLSNWDDVLDSLKNIEGTVFEGNRVWVPTDWGHTSILFRTDLAPEYVDNDTYGILWDPKYKGKVACFDSLVDCVSIAAIMAGVDPFKYTDESLEKTREKMRELVQNIRYFSNDPTSLEQGLASGELVAASAWNESVVRLKEQGLPVKFMDPKEGVMTWVCGLSIGAYTQHYDKAHDMIDAMLDPRSGVYEMKTFGYGVSTKSAYELIDDETLRSLGLSKNPLDTLNKSIYQQQIDPEGKVQAMFDEVKAGF